MDYWNAFVKESEHKHEEGEDTSKCANCRAGRLAGNLTEFEGFCLTWYRANVNQFAFDAHLIGELIKELGLTKETKTIFLKDTNMIYQNDIRIAQAKAAKLRGK